MVEFEVLARKKVVEFVGRGSIHLFLSLREGGSNSKMRINKELLLELIEQIREISSQDDTLSLPSLDGLLAVKGVVESAEISFDPMIIQELNRNIGNGLVTALTNLKEARQEEGEKINLILNELINKVDNLGQQAAELIESQPKQRRQLMEEQNEELL